MVSPHSRPTCGRECGGEAFNDSIGGDGRSVTCCRALARYGLLAGPGDRAQLPGWEANLTARPNFFANLLHKRFVGAKVLNATLSPGPRSKGTGAEATTAVYAYCAADGAAAAAAGGGGGGAVALVLLNFGRAGVSFDLGSLGATSVYALYGRWETRALARPRCAVVLVTIVVVVTVVVFVATVVVDVAVVVLVCCAVVAVLCWLR